MTVAHNRAVRCTAGTAGQRTITGQLGGTRGTGIHGAITGIGCFSHIATINRTGRVGQPAAVEVTVTMGMGLVEVMAQFMGRDDSVPATGNRGAAVGGNARNIID